MKSMLALALCLRILISYLLLLLREQSSVVSLVLGSKVADSFSHHVLLPILLELLLVKVLAVAYFL